MKVLEKLLALSLCISTAAFVVACDVDDEDADGGAGGGEAGAGGDVGGAGGDVGGAGGEAPVYNHLIIIDNSIDENMAGTPGADICGIEVDCNLSPAIESFVQGEGGICEEVGDNCSAARNDADAILDDGTTCEPASAPSDYLSLGLSGTVTVVFDGDLQGCGVTIRELVGNDSEGYQVQVCADEASTDCLPLDGEATTLAFEDGGEGTFTVPSAPEGGDEGGEGGAGGAAE
ncbi:MAG: hypothetical protein ACE366_09175 [Bradymonadia bacterium]